jgi:hypothetical protein
MRFPWGEIAGAGFTPNGEKKEPLTMIKSTGT